MDQADDVGNRKPHRMGTLVPVLGSMKPERLASMVKALEISLDRQQWFAILEASEGQPVA